MSRYQEWNHALNGISKTIKYCGFKVNSNNFTIESNFVNKYSKLNKLEGSFTERLLLISEDFKPFKQFLKDKKNV